MENTKTVKALKKQLVAAIAMVLVAAVALGSSTYAWFVTNNKVDATTSTISAQSNAAFMTIANGTSGAKSVDTTSVTTGVETKALYPATFGEETGSTKGTFMTGYGTALDNGTLKGGLTEIGAPEAAVTKGYALKQDYNVSSKGQNLTELKVEKVENAKNANSTSKLANALRVLVTSADGKAWVVYGLNAEGDAYEVKLSSETSADVVLGSVTAGEDTPVHVYLYYEGKDTNVTTEELQGGQLTATNAVTVYFTATANNK